MIGTFLTGVLISFSILLPEVKDVQSLYQYNIKEIRYQAEPAGIDYWQTPKETIEKKSGDCEDISFLNQEILKQLGYQSQVIWIYGYKNNKIYSHALCIFKINEKYRYFSNQFYNTKDFESIKDIIKFECPKWLWIREITLPHNLNNLIWNVKYSN